jgi:hypothetical protein
MKCGGGNGGDGGRDCGRMGKKMEETRGRSFAEDLLARSVFLVEGECVCD